MCLSTVYKLGEGQPQELASNISKFVIEDGRIIFTDLMGIETEVEGEIESVDFVDSKIFVA